MVTGFTSRGTPLTAAVGSAAEAPVWIHRRITVMSSGDSGVLPSGGMARSSPAGSSIRCISSLALASPGLTIRPCRPPRMTKA